MNQDQLIQQEVQRKTAAIIRESNDKVIALEDKLEHLKGVVSDQQLMLVQLTGNALYFGTVYQTNLEPDSSKYQYQDTVIVNDPATGLQGCTGTIVSNGPVVTDNKVQVRLDNEAQSTADFLVSQLKLIDKRDGTYVTLLIDGKAWEVKAPSFPVKCGDVVKIASDTKQIVEMGYRVDAGNIVRITAITPEGVEVEDKGEKKLVQNPMGLLLEEGDKVVTDTLIIFKKLPKDDRNRFKLTGEANVTWDDIGGLQSAKIQCQQALEWPYKYPELFTFYGIPKEKGILLYGPPGCGKSLIVRAVANAMAKIHGVTALETGYIYVKAPELLNKWVGNTEASIRELFEQARNHHRKHGYPAILAIDEADAIMPQRGSRVSSDISDTVVPMFLGEMDGIDDAQTKLNPIVFLLTNRPDMMDQAAIRSGRINKHIKIDRPDANSAFEILKLYTSKLPFAPGMPVETILHLTVSDIFSKSRLLYRINGEHDFCFSHCLNGAILEAMTVTAKLNALHRDLNTGSKGDGVTLEDFKHAVEKAYNEQKGLTHNYDLVDFAEKVGIQASSMKVERSLGM